MERGAEAGSTLSNQREWGLQSSAMTLGVENGAVTPGATTREETDNPHQQPIGGSQADGRRDMDEKEEVQEATVSCYTPMSQVPAM